MLHIMKSVGLGAACAAAALWLIYRRRPPRPLAPPAATPATSMPVLPAASLADGSAAEAVRSAGVCVVHDALSADESGELGSRAIGPERPSVGAERAPSNSWSNRPSTAPRRIGGSVLRERAAKKSQRALTTSRPHTSLGSAKAGREQLTRSQDPEPDQPPIRYISVPDHKPLNSIIASTASDAATPISPNTLHRRLQAATPHYYADKTGHVRHLAVDRSPRSRNDVKQSSGSGSQAPYRALRMARPMAAAASARPRANASKSLSTSGAQRRGHHHVASGASAANESGATPVEWLGGVPRPTRSRQKQGWSRGSTQKVLMRSARQQTPR